MIIPRLLRTCPWFFLYLLMVVQLLLVAGCANTFQENTLSGPTTLQLKVASTINTLRRTALVHLPRDFNPAIKYPLLVVLHGAFSTAEIMEEETGFSRIADREGFVVLYPEGMGIFGFLQHWNAGHCCGKAAQDDLNDVGFIRECIDKASEFIQIDEKKVYMTGFSNGGMMVYRYASERTLDLAAISVLGASIGGRPTGDEPIWIPESPSVPLPIMIVHGMADTAVPPEGGISPKKGGTREYLPLTSSIDFWLSANRCEPTFDEKTSYSERVTMREWSRCEEGSAVQANYIENWSHRWPGPFFTNTDPELSTFDISEDIWEFFKQYSR